MILKDNVIQLRAKSALLIYLGSFGGGILIAAILGGAICFLCPGHLGFDIRTEEGVLSCFKATRIHSEVIFIIISVISILTLSFFLVRSQLKDRTINGAAWVLGSRRELVTGLFIGLLIATAFLIMRNVNISNLTILKYRDLSLIFKFLAIVYTIIFVTVVPAFEELLYRGIILGGFNCSFGPIYEGILTTLLFIGMHIPSIITSGTFLFIAICSLSLTTLWIRLKTGAVGPAIAIHFSYNFIVAIYS